MCRSMASLSVLSSRPELHEALSQRKRTRRRSSMPMSGNAIEMHSSSEPADIETGLSEESGIPTNAVAEWGQSLLELDPELAQLRFRTVPAKMAEETFWSVCFMQ